MPPEPETIRRNNRRYISTSRKGKPTRKHRIVPLPNYVLDGEDYVREVREADQENSGSSRVCDLPESDHPVMRALSEEERTIYQFYRAGLLMREIAHMIGRTGRKDYVCRVLHAIREKIIFLWRVKVVLVGDSLMIEKFISWEVKKDG